MQLLKATLFATLIISLASCSLVPTPSSKTVVPQRHAWEHTQPGCQADDCPLVNIDTLTFTDDPQLNALIEKNLLEMTRDSEGDPLPASLQSYEQDFLASAQPGWSSYLQAKLREQHDGLLIIELSSYLATGGAHGMPGRRFINYDSKLKKPLTLRDMLLPGQEDAFWKLAQDAHRRWLAAEKLDQDADYQKTWPFQETANVALTYGAVLLKYDSYSIAPYSSGHPELKIPYPQLNGVLKPQYFPGRG
ncbi:RsiV family protein [Pseudomonas sp. LS44]|uniref:RsiV family protein n=1 Tax=Pseudomonas sp. LS44 TaxID=1357074 RepID=UPI00215AF462|nr:RsiV family protein [Pseudomonas sp. LS44]UVE17278.1 RsiV family protein [Pseudomonas sp. LS44]